MVLGESALETKAAQTKKRHPLTSTNSSEQPLDTFDINLHLLIFNFFFAYFMSSSPTYAITVSGITVGNKPTDLDFITIFDTGTSFTYLADPAYTYITQSVSKTFDIWFFLS